MGFRGYLLPIDPQNVFVPGGSIQTDRYYMIGSKLTIITSALVVAFLSVITNMRQFFLEVILLADRSLSLRSD